MKKAVITILGTIGGRFEQDKKEFVFVKNTSKSYYEGNGVIELDKNYYIDTLPILIDVYKDADIIPIFTKDAKKIQIEVLRELEDKEDYLYIFENGYEIRENDIDEIFEVFEKIFNKDYDEFIIDVTHGFRHLPLLLLIEVLIKNFQDNSKISKILFAKELIKPTKDNNFSGKYEFIDLKEYLDLANLAFVLETFKKNYTLPLHIKLNEEFKFLEEKLNEFSEDLMVLNIESLFKSAVPELINELKKVQKPSIIHQVKDLIKHLEEEFSYEGKYRYETYYNLAYNLRERGYLLNSLALLYESVRLFLRVYLNKKCPEIMEKVEEFFENDDYAIGDFCMNKVFNSSKKNIIKKYNKLNQSLKEILSIEEYKKLISSIPNTLRRWEKCIFAQKGEASIFNCISYARNNFAHANKFNNYDEVKENIDYLFEKFSEKIKGLI